jgi:hypothetical protein
MKKKNRKRTVGEIRTWNENIERMSDRFSQGDVREEQYGLFIPFGPEEEGLIWVQAVFPFPIVHKLKSILCDAMNHVENQIREMYRESEGVDTC